MHFASILLCLFPLSTAADKIDVLLFTHSMSVSHLSVVFDVAESYPSARHVYDIRWPLVQQVADFSSRPSFKKVIFNSVMQGSKALMKKVDDMAMARSGSILPMLEILGEVSGLILLPCAFNDTIPIPAALSTQRLSLIDPFSAGCSVAVSRKFGARHMFVSALVEPYTLQRYSGGPLIPSYAMAVMQAAPPSEMGFGKRIGTLFGHGFFSLFSLQMWAAKWWFGDPKDYMRPMEPTFTLVRTHKFMEFAGPRTNALVDIGNVWEASTSSSKQNKDLQTFVDRFETLAIFSMSTFSNDGELPPDKLQLFINAFRRHPKVGFVWRLKQNGVPQLPENIFLTAWFDQKGLLRHPKTKVLISHCGMNSVLEAFAAGVSVIAIPTMGDQFPNAERIKHTGTGIVLNLHSLTDDLVANSIAQLIHPASEHARRGTKVKSMLRFEAEQGMRPNVTQIIDKYLRHSPDHFSRFYVPFGALMGWIPSAFLDWTAALLLLVILMM